MGAFVSLAFGWTGSLEDSARLNQALDQVGLYAEGEGRLADGMIETNRVLSIAGERLTVAVRSYQENGWVSTSLDVDEATFEAMGDRHGRAMLVDAFISVGAQLLRYLDLRYVFFDEEAEAEIDPTEYRADCLFGISLVAEDAPGLDAARGRPDLLRVEEFEGGVVLFRRLDPIPHFQPRQ